MPFALSGYKEKGQYTTVDGMKTYATGSSSAKSAILVVYDIFGFFPQTIQGADILAYGDKEKQYVIHSPIEQIRKDADTYSDIKFSCQVSRL